MHTYYVYILTNTNRGLYIGVTKDLHRRMLEHKEGLLDGFTKTYRMHRLIYFEEFTDIREAIAREKRLKWWPRKWKVRLVELANPEWNDLAKDWFEAAD
jgi:putative endonuclease